MTDEHLTTELAVRAMHWRLAPGRYLKPEGSWTSRSGFRPLVDVNNAFRVLDTVTGDYTLRSKRDGSYTVEVRVERRTAKAISTSKARAICLAIAQVLGIDAAARD